MTAGSQPAHMPLVPEIFPAGPDGPRLCEPVLRSVPEWFGIESATLKYIADTARMPTWVAMVDGLAASERRAAGFITINRHFPESAEVHCIAVHKDHHGRAVGTALLRFVEGELRRDGVEYLQVKTMGPSKPTAEYAMTLRFYRSRGFTPVEEIHGLWPGIPALVLIKRL